MCGIAGFYNKDRDFHKEKKRWYSVLDKMNRSQKHRGPDDEGAYLCRRCGMAHVRLSIIDLVTGHQPMIRKQGGRECTIVMNGEIYNMKELREELRREGVEFDTQSDTEVVLAGYMIYGEEYIRKLNGIFAFAIWEERTETLLLVRDRLGIKPLFYTWHEGTLVFGSELKALFCYPEVNPKINRASLCEIFGLGPAKTYGKGVFQDVYEVLPGHKIHVCQGKMMEDSYWSLESHPHEDTLEQTIEHTAYLVEDAVKLQMLSDIPISTFLSGGLDSSLVTAICAKELKKDGKMLNTFSFDFQGNQKFFKANAFQPSRDRPWVDQMVDYCGTNHHYLECDNSNLVDELYRAVEARDLPCMADVESSLLYFCSKVVPYNKVTLTGECADEIFGGYPWFHKKEAFDASIFPWSTDFGPRKLLLRDDVLSELPLEEYASAAYEKTIAETPTCHEDTAEEKRRREISYLNLRWFMVTLLDRMDRTSMHCGLEARVPLADHRIVEYVWNVPWEFKSHGGIVKALLRSAGQGKLPEDVLWRKKSPYPKTYHPEYEKMLGNRLREVMADSNAPIRTLLDTKKVETFLRSPSDYGRPWYGQLMAGPQLIAYMLQVNYWLEQYHLTGSPL